MKTKLSKKLLSALLAVVLVITSVPVVAFTAFGADDAVTQVEAAMTAFEEKLASEGAFKNVPDAYLAYVDAQEALDAYTYGGETDALSGKADALNAAVANIQPFTGVQVKSKVPKFDDDSSDPAMSSLEGTAYSNLLWTSDVDGNSLRVDSTGHGSVNHHIWYAADNVVFFDGKSEIRIPVMVDGNVTSNRTQRFIYSVFPCNADGTGDDTDGWYFPEDWRGGAGATRDWTWSWTQSNRAAKDYSEGAQGRMTSSGKHSYQIYKSNLVWEGQNPTTYMANALSFKNTATPADYGQEYTLTWYMTTGGSGNDDLSVTQANAPIRLVNYKTLSDAMQANGSKMKGIDLSTYSEGGLEDYIYAMEDAAQFDVNYFFANASSGATAYENCIARMKSTVSAMNNADTTKTDSDAYQSLRASMDASMANYVGGQNGYTEETYAPFKAKYEEAKAVMAKVNDSGYADSEETVQTLATELYNLNKALATKVTTVDVTALQRGIDIFTQFSNDVFTAETYNPAAEKITEAKIAIWSSVENYGQPNKLLPADEAGENQRLVDAYTEEIKTLISNMRFSMDYVVSTDFGGYSVNSAMALKEAAGDPTQYSNYSTLETALGKGDEYIDKAKYAPLEDYVTQLAEYTTTVTDIVASYNSLAYAFTSLPDGTVANDKGMVAMTDLAAYDQGSQSFAFSKTGDAVVIRTTHDAATVKYGTANMRFESGINNNDCQHNMLDSININATAHLSSDNTNGAKNHITSSYLSTAGFQGSIPSLSDSQRTEFAGSLRNGAFSLSNIRYTGKSANNNADQILVTADGTRVTDGIQAQQMDLSTLLGVTDGVGGDPPRGGLFAHTTNDNAATTSVSADLNVDIPATEAVDPLGVGVTGAKTTTIQATGDLGVVTTWNVRNTTNYGGYNYMNSTDQNSEKLTFKVDVIDISNFIDLVNLCDASLSDSWKYTDATWNKFVRALEAANADYDYSNATAVNMRTEFNNRFNALKTAYNALEERWLFVTFSFKDAEGNDAVYKLDVVAGTTLTDYTDKINEFVKPGDYTQGAYSYKFNGNWSPAVDMNEIIKAERTYTAQYDKVLNLADFTAFNAAKTDLINTLADEKFSVASLEAAAALANNLTYLDYTAEQQAGVYADKQSEIDAETEALKSAKAALVEATYDIDVAKAVAEQITVAQKNDPDRYDNSLTFTYTQNVNVVGQDVAGLIYADQQALNDAIKAAVEGMQPLSYTVALNGTDLVTVPYGTSVTVYSDGTYDLASQADASYSGDKLAWSYSYSAPSIQNSATAPKFICTSEAYSFVVKGDTYLTTTAAQGDTENHVVTIYSSINYRVIEVINTTGEFTMPEAYAYPFYNFAGYSNGANAGDVVTVTADTAIVASYEPKTENTFRVTFYDSYANWFGATSASDNYYNYNELVELTAPDAYCWAKASIVDDVNYITALQILSYGSSYSFNAAQNMGDDDFFTGIVAMTKAEYEALQHPDDSRDDSAINSISRDYLVDGSGTRIVADGDKYVGFTYTYNPIVSQLENGLPVYGADNTTVEKFTLVGNAAVPEGYTILETGFMFSTDMTATDFAVDKADNKTMFRYKTSKLTKGKQFAINVVNPASDVEYQYAAYMIIKDADGNVSTHYTNPIAGDNKF